MRTAQRVIKAFAIALAAVIIVAMVSVAAGLVSTLGFFAWGDEIFGENNSSWTSSDYSAIGINEIEINVKATSLKLRTTKDGEAVRVETNNDKVYSSIDGRKITVIEKSSGFFGWGGKGEVIVYVRDDVVFDRASIEAGAGMVEIDNLEAKNLALNLGAGKTRIENLKVTEKAKIDGGAGLIEIKKGEIKNLDLDHGVGEAKLKLKLTGENTINCGVGAVNLDLIGESNDYRFTLDKGIGDVKLDGVSLGDGAIVGQGETRVDIDSGVGSVKINIVAE